MGLEVKVTLEGAIRISESVWQVEVEPERLAILGRPAVTGPGPSVVFLEDGVTQTAEGVLEFRLDGANLLNLGTMREAIIVDVNAPERAGSSPGDATPEASFQYLPAGGDKDFLESLPRTMLDLGEQFLRAMRSEFPGRLEHREVSGRWIEIPDAWWTIKPQPYKQNFYISVRRPPEDYDVPSSIVMKRERASWSRLYLGSIEQLDDVMMVMRQAARYQKRRPRG